MADRKKRCVIADDVRASRLVLQAWMQEFDFDCTLVPDGAEAEGVLRDEGADLVITDIEMPGMNGLQLLRCVRADDSPEVSSIPVIVVSSLDDPRVGEVVEALGGTGFLGKPLDKELLRQAVERIESGCRNLREVAIERRDGPQRPPLPPALRRLSDVEPEDA